MNPQVLHPPKAPTDQLCVESFKTLSRLLLIFEFRPWLEYSREYVRRRTDSPYFVLWDCLCFGAPLNTLLELVGSPTPRHLAVTVDDFDFGLSIHEREEFFASFIQRVHSLEHQGMISFGEVLRIEDFTSGLNAGFWRILQTINRVIYALEASYPGLFAVSHGSEARRRSLITQLIDSERMHVATLALTADFASKLYEDPLAEHPSLEGFIVNCSRLIPYHDHILKSLLESVESWGHEEWDVIFSLHNKVFYSRMNIAYRSICANYLSFQNFLSGSRLDEESRKYSKTILLNLSAILNRFTEYQNIIHAILSVTPPTDRSSYNSLCAIALESSAIASSLSEVGLELRTMSCFHLLGPRFGFLNPLDSEPSLGLCLLDDCLIANPESGQYFSVFLFQTRILCCADHRRSDMVNVGGCRYPIRPWEAGPALEQTFLLHVVLSIPTSDLRVLHCIDTEYFELTWGTSSSSESRIMFFPMMPHQFNQWTAALEPFVSRVVHSTSVKESIEDTDGASVYSGHVSLIPTSDDRHHNKWNGRRRSSVAKPWSLIGRKGVHSESSSVVGLEVGRGDIDRASILSPNMLPTLFLGDFTKSPLRQGFVPGEDEISGIPLIQLVTDSPTEYQPTTTLFPMTAGEVPDLTRRVRKEGHFPVAHGGYSDVWKGVWIKKGEEEAGGGGGVKVAVKVLRNTTNDPEVMERLVKRLNNELRVWKQLIHPHILELCGTVSDFGPHSSMVCPWMRNGSVTKHLERSGDILSVEDRLKMIVEVADGLAYLHPRSIVHGDLSGSNILIDDQGHARLTDFGLSTLLLEEPQSDSVSALSTYTSHLGGSVRWADAALFRSFDDENPPVISTANDIYSFGSVMLEILSGRMPYHYLRTDTQVVIQLHQGIQPRRPASTFIDDAQWDVIQRCWKDQLQERPTAIEACRLAKGLLDVWLRPVPSIASASSLRKSA